MTADTLGQYREPIEAAVAALRGQQVSDMDIFKMATGIEPAKGREAEALRRHCTNVESRLSQSRDAIAAALSQLLSLQNTVDPASILDQAESVDPKVAAMRDFGRAVDPFTGNPQNGPALEAIINRITAEQLDEPNRRLIASIQLALAEGADLQDLLHICRTRFSDAQQQGGEAAAT